MPHLANSSTRALRQSDVDRRYAVFLGQLSIKGRVAIQKHDELCAADAALGQGELWKRLAGGLARLADYQTESLGQQVVKFYIADGKYRQQVFALEDTRQGTIAVYLPDVVALAIAQKILAGTPIAGCFKVIGGDVELHLAPLDAETRDLTAFKAMVGWGRHALRADLNTFAKEKQVRAVERMCELAAEKWAAVPQATPA
jgi:hypothetical protein